MKKTTMLKNETEFRRRARRTQSGHRDRARRGTSLVEILIVLVILLIGVFLAIRIFPAGLATLQTTENRGRATHLAQQAIGDQTSNADNLPDGVLSAVVVKDSNGIYGVNFNTTLDPDDLGAVTITVPNAVTSIGPDVNKATYIKSEPVKVPAPVLASNGEAVSPYLVRFGPMQLDATVGNPDSAPTSIPEATHYGAFLSVHTGPLGITRFDSQGGSPINAQSAVTYVQGPLNCLVDYGSGTSAYILFAPGATGTYTISYSYYTSTTNVAAVTTVTSFGFPASGASVTGGTWIPITLYNGNPLPMGSNGLVPGSVTVTRVLARENVSSPFPMGVNADPFIYKLASNNTTGTTVNPGLLYFSPLLAGLAKTGAAGTKAATVYVDYFVADWHILHDDVQVPTVTPNAAGLIPVKLSLDVIKRVGDANPDNSIYANLYNSSDPTAQDDIDAIGLGTAPGGSEAPVSPELGQGTVVRGVPTPAINSANAPAYYVDTDSRSGTYRTGNIYVNPNVLPQGSQLRVYYRADGDWAVALQKAFAQYTPETSTASMPATSVNGSSVIQNRPLSYQTFGIDRSAGNRLYFWRDDLNKSVLVSLQYVSNGVVVRVPPTQFTIDNTTSDHNYAYIDLANGVNANALSSADQAGIAADPNWTVYGPIQGVSVRERVIWKDNNNTNNNWRVQDLDTFLTAPGT